jgi:hypothetical protein
MSTAVLNDTDLILGDGGGDGCCLVYAESGVRCGNQPAVRTPARCDSCGRTRNGPVCRQCVVSQFAAGRVRCRECHGIMQLEAQ